jgi:cell division protease FtsH
VRRIIDRAHELARSIIRENRAKLDQMARKLIEVESLEGDALEALMRAPTDQDPPMDEPAAPTPPPSQPYEPEPRSGDDQPRPQPRPGLAWGSGGTS